MAKEFVLEDHISYLITKIKEDAHKRGRQLKDFLQEIPQLQTPIFKGQKRFSVSNKRVYVEVLECETLVTWKYCSPEDIPPAPARKGSFVYIPEPRLWPTEFRLAFPEVE